jgi:hypothetical protein
MNLPLSSSSSDFVSSSVSSRLQSRVSRLLSTRSRSSLDSSSFLDSFSYLSDLSSSSSVSFSSLISERRSLLPLLETRSIALQRELLTSAHPIVNHLQLIRSNLEELTSVQANLSHKLTSIKSENERLMVELSVRHERIKSFMLQRRLVERFLSHFQLSSDELTALEGEIIDNSFFKAVKRIVELRSACHALTGQDEGRIAIDLIDSFNRRLDLAYERLYRWVQGRCQRLNKQDEGIQSDLLSGALDLLRSQPVYYDHCISEIAAARRLLVLNQFLQALTKGGGSMRAIELSVHDPIKYATEILAWIHQALANEREFLTAFLINIDHSTTLGLIFDGVARPIRLRLEQAIQSAQSPDAAFRLYQMLLFYSPVLCASFTPDSAIATSLQQSVAYCNTSLFDCLKRWSDRFNVSPPSPSADLNVSPAVQEALATINSLALSFQSSIAGQSAMAVDHSFSSVFSSCFDPLFHSIPLGCSHLEPSDSLVAQINFLHTSILIFHRFSFLKSQISDLTNRFDTLVQALIEVLVDLNWQKCGLREVIRAIGENSQPLTGSWEFSQLVRSLDLFARSLLTAGAFFMPQCDQIFDHRTRQKCRKLVALRISQQYKILHQTISSWTPNSSERVGKSPNEIELLLEVDQSELSEADRLTTQGLGMAITQSDNGNQANNSQQFQNSK